MRGGGHDGFATGLSDALRDLVAVGGDHDAVGDAEGADTLEDPDDDGDASELTKGLSGEPSGAQSSWDDGERLHAIRGADATFTPRKLPVAPRKR
jgi:hypothetical protein